MPDFDKLKQIQMLTNILSSMPPQIGQTQRVSLPWGKAAQWAVEAYSMHGVRVHPDLARSDTLPEGVSVVERERRLDDVATSAADLLGLLRSVGNAPSLALLADRLERVLGDPAAEAAELDRIRRENPDILRTANQMLAAAQKQQGAS